MSAQTDIEPVATTFRAIGTDHTILATDPDALEPAVVGGKADGIAGTERGIAVSGNFGSKGVGFLDNDS